MSAKILDFLGREIKVGDFAIYSKTANQIAETAICLVVAIFEDGTNVEIGSYERPACKLGLNFLDLFN